MTKKIFTIEEKGSSYRTEIVAGLTTFVAMSYILFVNPGMFAELSEVTYGAAYVSTALAAVIGTVLIGLLADLPLAQAPGMGLNAFFVYTICFGLGFSYANALLFVLADGILFVVLTVTGIRTLVFEAIPKSVKAAIPAGIGLFIAFIGLQDSHIIVNDSATCVALASFNLLGSATWGSVMPLLITIATLIAIAVLSRRKVQGAILWSILGGTALYYLLGLTVPGFYRDFSLGSMNPLSAFSEFAELSFGKVFTEGFDFSGYLSTHTVGALILSFITTSLALCLIDMFDTVGTLYGACKSGNMMIQKENGEEEIPSMERAMLADAIATCTGAICGTSTVTSFVEAASGAAAGGKTGFSAVVTGILFFAAMFLSPIAALIPACAYAAALIYVGILMMGGVTEIDWKDPAAALPSFMTIVMMPFTYNISYGIALGLLVYIAIELISGNAKKINTGTWVIGLLFISMFFLTH